MANELGVVNTRLDGMLVIELMPLVLRTFNSSLPSNFPPSPFNASAEFIKYFCLAFFSFFSAFLGTKLSLYIFDVWL